MKRGREFRNSEQRGRKTPAPKMPWLRGGLGDLPQDLSVAMFGRGAQYEKTEKEAGTEEDGRRKTPAPVKPRPGEDFGLLLYDFRIAARGCAAGDVSGRRTVVEGRRLRR